MDNVLNIEGNSNKELKETISKQFTDLFWQTLTFLEVAFPHQKGDGTENEKKYNSIRSKILRIGNDNVRELDNIFSSYVSFKVYEYIRQPKANIETRIYDFRSQYKILGGKDVGK